MSFCATRGKGLSPHSTRGDDRGISYEYCRIYGIPDAPGFIFSLLHARPSRCTSESLLPWILWDGERWDAHIVGVLGSQRSRTSIGTHQDHGRTILVPVWSGLMQACGVCDGTHIASKAYQSSPGMQTEIYVECWFNWRGLSLWPCCGRSGAFCPQCANIQVAGGYFSATRGLGHCPEPRLLSFLLG
jgi:hypothetical protein